MLSLETLSGSDLAAQLARAAYSVALKHGVEGSWIDLEVEMWDALSRILENHESHGAPACSCAHDAVTRPPK